MSAQSSAKGSGKYNLTQGGILNKLLLVALPIMGTQFIQMTYNLTDMFWLGRVGSNAVAASGTVGMYLWLSMAFVMFGRMGAEIGVAQNIGKGDTETARKYGEAAVFIAAALGVAYGALLFLANEPLIGFFNIKEAEVVSDAQVYLRIISVGMPFSFVTAAVTGIFNGSGNSRVPFIINGIGLALNMILDPLFILQFGMGVAGAAIATIAAQAAAAFLSFLALFVGRNRPFASFRPFSVPKQNVVRQIFKWSFPISVESFLFTFLSMIIARFVAAWGASAISAQRIGSQIESLSWLIGGGFSSAVTAFTGQNFGAGKWTRIHKGFRISCIAMSVWGVFITLVLYFGAEFLFSLFLPGDMEVLAIGRVYLRILSVCQLAACLEGVASGIFRGLGKTLPPSLTSIVSNVLRVIASFAVTRASLGLNGIWWSICLTALARSLCILIWYLIKRKSFPALDAQPPATAKA